MAAQINLTTGPVNAGRSIALNSHDEVSTITAAKGLTRSLVNYAFINRNQETFTVTRICDMMDVFPECLL